MLHRTVVPTFLTLHMLCCTAPLGVASLPAVVAWCILSFHVPVCVLVKWWIIKSTVRMDGPMTDVCPEDSGEHDVPDCPSSKWTRLLEDGPEPTNFCLPEFLRNKAAPQSVPEPDDPGPPPPMERVFAAQETRRFDVRPGLGSDSRRKVKIRKFTSEKLEVDFSQAAMDTDVLVGDTAADQAQAPSRALLRWRQRAVGSVACAAFVRPVNLRHLIHMQVHVMLVIRGCFAAHLDDDAGFRIFRTRSLNTTKGDSSRDTCLLCATRRGIVLGSGFISIFPVDLSQKSNSMRRVAKYGRMNFCRDRILAQSSADDSDCGSWS